MSDSANKNIGIDKDKLARISRENLAENLWQLVCVPSPTGREKNAAVVFAEMLGSAGARVEIDRTLPESPNVIGRLRGRKPGRTIQLAGHIDHIDQFHPEPKRDNEKISGRGSADMKNGLAGILEIVRILNEAKCDFPGEILVTVYGLHEAPDGDSRGLLNLIDKGIKGDAAIVFEGPDDAAAIMANGMSIWNLTIHHEQPACHELCVDPERPDLLEAVTKVTEVLRDKNKKLRSAPSPFSLLGPESLFVGQIHYGDFYNRVPDKAFMQGTRRWHPDKTYEQIKFEFEKMLGSISLDERILIDNNWIYVGDSYEVSQSELIVKSLINAFESVHNKSCPVRGHGSVTDVCRLVSRAKIPAVLCGFGTETGHADYEFVTMEKVKRSCEIALQTVMNYLNSG